LPRVGRLFDEEESALFKAVEGGQLVSHDNISERRKVLREIARDTILGNRTRISLRVQSEDLARLRAIAYERGIPYQTLINSIIHQYAKGNLKEDA
jgi:predicted DNA binding CopG/RHH family protein